MKNINRAVAAFALVALLSGVSGAQGIDPQMYAGLKWRCVGPFRAGRVSAVSGVIGRPGVFYMGLPMGGLWRTTNAGVTWDPVFDSVKDVASIGSVQVAPSNPNIIYVGTGDFSSGGCPAIGNGVYKSTDGGASWSHIGLVGTQHIPSMVVDPNDPDHVLVAARGDSREASKDRGVYLTKDGGKTWKQVLFPDDRTGVERLAFAWDVPHTVYATTVKPGSSSDVYRSTDDGETWIQVKGEGMPSLSGRTCVAVAPKTNAQRIFVTSNTGLFRSDDAGAHWRQMDRDDRRVRNGQGGYNCGIYVNTGNPDILYLVNTCSYISLNGGETFTGFKGAPGGDDPQQMWLDPTDPDRFIFGVDQGATVSLDGGRTWSNWYNQPSAQVYHIAVDNQYPYWIYATQQDSGAVGTSSRGNYGEITPLDWHPHPGYEFGSLAIDPRDPDISYCGSDIGGIIRVTRKTGQYIDVSPIVDRKAGLRKVLNQPLAFNPNNPRELLAGFQFLMSTTDGGKTWRKLSPDLGAQPEAPKPPAGAAKTTNPPPASSGGNFAVDDDMMEGEGGEDDPTMDDDERLLLAQRRGGASIESFSVSTVNHDVFWVGLNTGGVKMTPDHGKTWLDVTPKGLPEGSDISGIDASHHDADEAYIAVDCHNRGDYAPHVYRTKDRGKSWTAITQGIPAGKSDMTFARVIKSDPERKGLLFLGTESFVYVSFDDGDHWQSLALNQPNTSYRDMVIKGNDIIVGTYGRSFWILDDISPLRQVSPMTESEPAHLFQPGDAVRIRRNVNGGTPFPPEVVHAENPPLGATLYYWLGKPANKVDIEIADSTGKVWRHISSVIPEVKNNDQQPIPDFWKEVVRPLPTAAGMWRVNWNVRADDPPSAFHSYGINANPFETPMSPEGPLVPPGVYTVRLIVDGKKSEQTLKVINDPRSPASPSDIRSQWAVTSKLYETARRSSEIDGEIGDLRTAVRNRLDSKPTPEVDKAVRDFEKKLNSLDPEPQGGGGFRRGGFTGGPPSFRSVNSTCMSLMNSMEFGDSVPTDIVSKSAASVESDFVALNRSLKKLVDEDLAALNSLLEKNKQAKLPVPRT